MQTTAGNVTRAAQLLAQGMQEEGWTSLAQMPSITFTYNAGSQTTQNEVAAVIQMWQNVLGISVKAAPIDVNQLGVEISGSKNNPKGLQFWRYTWFADYPDAQDWLTLAVR